MAVGACAVNSDDDDEWSADPETDPLARIIEASYRELHAIACAKAREIVRSPYVAEDIVQEVWGNNALGPGLRPDPRPIRPRTSWPAVRKRCFTELTTRKTVPAADDVIEAASLRNQDSRREEETVVEQIANLQARISAAIDILDLTPSQARMLHMMIGPEPLPHSAADSDGDRGARRRLRARVEILAKLTQEERSAVESHAPTSHDLAVAENAAAGITVRGTPAQGRLGEEEDPRSLQHSR